MEEKKRKMAVLVFLVILLVVYDVIMIGVYYSFQGLKVPRAYSVENIKIDGKVLDLSSLTLKQKLSQMIVVSGRRNSPDIMRMNVGGIYLFGQNDKDWYVTRIRGFKNASRLQPFFSTDLEGYWNPFKNFYNSSVLGEIKSEEEARVLGEEHGKLLQEIGFTMNFAPVAEADGKVWPGRGWNASTFEIGEWASAYVRGLQSSGVLAVVKHYPGGSIDSKDPHLQIVEKEIMGEERFPFLVVLRNEVSGVMVGHVVASGEIDSGGRPCPVSRTCVESIRRTGFEGLVVTDEVNMEGLRQFYSSKEEMYVDLINEGNDVILDFSLTPRKLDRLLGSLERMAEDGKISQEQIDHAVIRILKAKGHVVA